MSELLPILKHIKSEIEDHVGKGAWSTGVGLAIDEIEDLRRTINEAIEWNWLTDPDDIPENIYELCHRWCEQCETTKSSEFSQFIRNASPEEKERVYRKVIADANAEQRSLMDKN